MKLVLTSSSIEKLEKMLNEYHFSKTYKIIEGKVMFKNPLTQNENYIYMKKGMKHQIYRK